MEGAGKETRGSGTAAATIRSELHDRDGQTEVTVHTSLNATGRPAQFGRGVMAGVSAKLIGIFATNLADMLTAGNGAAPGGHPGASRARACANGHRRHQPGGCRHQRGQHHDHRGTSPK